MKSRDAVLTARRCEAEEKTSKVSDIERTIGEFEFMAADLDQQIEAEERGTGVRDPLHVSYSTFAASAARRRDNLRFSILEFTAKLEIARRERDEALKRLARIEARRSAARGRASARLAPALGSR